MEVFSRWESAVFNVEIENGAGSAGGTGTEERVRVAGTGVSSVTGRSCSIPGTLYTAKVAP